MKKREFVKRRLEEIETARTQREARKFYRDLKTHSTTFQPKLNVCIDKNGNTLVEEEEILDR